MKSYSRIFTSIHELVMLEKVPTEFRVKDVLSALGTSYPFLSKHAIDIINSSKKAEGNAYFIRVSPGLYRINPVWL